MWMWKFSEIPNSRTFGLVEALSEPDPVNVKVYRLCTTK